MKVILPIHKKAEFFLGLQTVDKNVKYRWFTYCATLEVDDGLLIHNTLTKELVLLDKKEALNPMDIPELIERWFFVPEEHDDKAMVQGFRAVLKSVAPKYDAITKYTILTTSDCNARCFYCFEHGWNRMHMTDEVAEKSAEYILRRSKGKRLLFHWFGGEPLYNERAMDIICQRMQENNTEYMSVLFSNGYLISPENIDKAINFWKIKKALITIDGTEEVYNKCKNYIYKDGSAYQRVMRNIGLLADAGVLVKIRINIDLHNAGDIMDLVDELAKRFGGNENVIVITQLLYELDRDVRTQRDEAHRDAVYECERKLIEKLEMHGLQTPARIDREYHTYFCMADSGYARMILPDGRIGLCEHYLDSEICGHLDTDEEDEAVLADWRRMSEEIPECDDCKIYPTCMRLDKCEVSRHCYVQKKQSRERALLKSMKLEYDLYLKQNKQ